MKVLKSTMLKKHMLSKDATVNDGPWKISEKKRKMENRLH